MRRGINKVYLTSYEKELLEQIELLERHIEERNRHLIKVNGYAPSDPLKLDMEFSDRMGFTLEFVSKEKFFELFEIKRGHVRKGKDPFLMIVRKTDNEPSYMNSMYVLITDMRKMKELIGKRMNGTIESDGHIKINGFDMIRFSSEMFTNIQPSQQPELIW